MAYRILSLDGGGPWALLQVMALQQLYGKDTLGYEVLDKFDLVAASCGGSITLAGLALNKPLNAILEDFFLDDDWRQRCFARASVLSSKYSTNKKLTALQEKLGGQRKSSWRPWSRVAPSTQKTQSLFDVYRSVKANQGVSPDFLICAYDPDRRRTEFFRSDLGSRSASATSATTNPSLAEVINASTTGPAHLFDAPAEIGESRFWDAAPAGLYNPILAAVTEALANGNEAEDIQVLSLGTGTVQLSSANGKGNNNPNGARKKSRQNARTLATSIFDDPPDSATFIAHVVLRQPLPSANSPRVSEGTIVRLSPVIRWRDDGKPLDLAAVKPGEKQSDWLNIDIEELQPLKLDDNEFQKLAALERVAVEREQLQLIRKLGALWIMGVVQNQPIRASRAYRCEVGHETFGAGVETWAKLLSNQQARRP